MAINPVTFAHKVNDQFLKYQFTAFPLSDPNLSGQAKEMLRGDPAVGSPLVKGPFLSISKSFRTGANLNDLVSSGIVHPALPGITEFPVLFAHQEKTLLASKAGKHSLVMTGTGSGKTEAFLFPIVDHCLRLRDSAAPPGVVAILIYPMNALAIDQLRRLRRMLAGTQISFGMYIGSTPADDGGVTDIVQMKEGEGKADFPRYERKYKSHERVEIAPFEERLTEKAMAERPPRILLTNVNQLELLLTRRKDLGMFDKAPLKFLVFDEAHTYSGATGAEVACLIRRIRAFCGKTADEITCIGTSATITDPVEGEAAGIEFAHRFFGVGRGNVELVCEEYLEEEWPSERIVPGPPARDSVNLLARTFESLDDPEPLGKLRLVVSELTGVSLPEGVPWNKVLYDSLKRNEFVRASYEELACPVPIDEAVRRINARLSRTHSSPESGRAELLAYLALCAAAESDGNPLLRPKVHYFVRGLEGAAVAFVESDGKGPMPRLFFSADAALGSLPEYSPTAIFPVSVCKTCGQHYLITRLQDIQEDKGGGTGGNAEGSNVVWESSGDGEQVVFTDRFLAELEEEGENGRAPEVLDKITAKLDLKRFPLYLCRYCGSFHKQPDARCSAPRCKRDGELVPVHVLTPLGKVHICPSCGQRGREIGERTIEPIRQLRAITVADVHILSQNMINAVAEKDQKLLVFTDNRQDAAFQAGWMQDHARRYRLRHLVYDFLVGRGGPTSLGDIQEHLLVLFRREKDLAMALAPEVFSHRVEEAFGRAIEEDLRKYLRINLVRELATGFKQRDGLEVWGLARIVYKDLTPEDPRILGWAEKFGRSPEEITEGISTLLDAYRRNRLLWDEAQPIFSRYWAEGDPEILRGYLPLMDFPPKGIKLTKEEGDNANNVVGVISSRGQTLSQNFMSKWGLAPDEHKAFLQELWDALTGQWRILAPVTLTGSRGRALPGCTGLYQVDTRKIGILPQRGRYRCNVCQRVHARITPNGACTAMHCRGTIRSEEPPTDDYNVALLGMPFSMLMPQEHSAQVPAKVREKVETEFKREGGRYNPKNSSYPPAKAGTKAGRGGDFRLTPPVATRIRSTM